MTTPARLARISAVLMAALCGCTREPPAPAGLTMREGPADALQWSAPGWLELVPTLRPPTTQAGDHHIRVFLRLPVEGALEVARAAGGAQFLHLPAGAELARVEFKGPPGADAAVGAGWQVLDVRSTRFEPEGERFCVDRPARRGLLRGVCWRRGAVSDAAAGAHLAALVRAGTLAGPEGADAREAAGKRLEGLNGCSGCHQPFAPQSLDAKALVQRGTDGRGSFQLRSAFEDEGPVERYRPRNTNAADPFITWSCAGAVGSAESLCPSGERPLARLDLPRALRANDAHARAVCQTRAALAPRLSDAARALVAPRLEACAELAVPP